MTSDRPTGDLMRDLIDQFTRLLRDEVRLARAELGEKLDQVKAAGGLLAGALAFTVGGVVLTLMAAAAALAEVMAPWAASLIVGIAALAIAALLAGKAQSNLKAKNLTPSRTVETLRSNAQFVKEKVR